MAEQPKGKQQRVFQVAGNECSGMSEMKTQLDTWIHEHKRGAFVVTVDVDSFKYADPYPVGKAFSEATTNMIYALAKANAPKIVILFGLPLQMVTTGASGECYPEDTYAPNVSTTDTVAFRRYFIDMESAVLIKRNFEKRVKEAIDTRMDWILSGLESLHFDANEVQKMNRHVRTYFEKELRYSVRTPDKILKSLQKFIKAAVKDTT